MSGGSSMLIVFLEKELVNIFRVLYLLTFTKGMGKNIAGPRTNIMYYNILFKLPTYSQIHI
jgi:hypothetical protein